MLLIDKHTRRTCYLTRSHGIRDGYDIPAIIVVIIKVARSALSLRTNFRKRDEKTESKRIYVLVFTA